MALIQLTSAMTEAEERVTQNSNNSFLHTDAIPTSAKGAAGGVMALPPTLPAAGSLLSMGADGKAAGAFIPFCCVLHPTASGWTILNDSGHTPLNVQSVEVSADGTYLILHHAAGASKVYSFQISPDEQFAKYGITAGASVGVDYSNIYLYMHIKASGWAVYNSPSWTIQPAYSNLCLSAAWSDTYGGLAFTFDSNLSCATVTDFSAHFVGISNTSGYQIRVRSPTPGQVIVLIYNSSNTLITTQSEYTNIICSYEISNYVTPASLVTYPIAASDFFISGWLLK